MARELAFVLINPYTISKSRTGGVIARYLGRTGLDLVAARMFGPSAKLVERYAALVRQADPAQAEASNLIADYIQRAYAPDPATGKPKRVMMLLLEGENAVRKVWEVTGSATSRRDTGETVRDTYGDHVRDNEGRVLYFEPAVLVAPNRQRVAATLGLWAHYTQRDGGIIEFAGDVPEGKEVEKTLVMLKPDNFRIPSLRAGNIIDLLSSSGLRIIGVKKLSMTVAQAEEFYAPVQKALASKFKDIGAKRAADALAREFGFRVPEDTLNSLCSQLGPLFAEAQFESIIQFMTGYRPSECSAHEKRVLGREACLALVYDGIGAVGKIRAILGSTDPSQAKPGSVRREFGSDIMVNAAHASDSRENAAREMSILKVEQDTIRKWYDRHYGNVVSRLMALRKTLPRAQCEWQRRIRSKWQDKATSTNV